MLARCMKVYLENSLEDTSNLNWKMEEAWEENKKSQSSSKVDKNLARNLANLVLDFSNQ